MTGRTTDSSGSEHSKREVTSKQTTVSWIAVRPDPGAWVALRNTAVQEHHG